MSAHSWWKRGKRARVWHEFEMHTTYGMDGPRDHMRSLCERHEFTLDSRMSYYEPWMGDDFPPDAVMCKKCVASR